MKQFYYFELCRLAFIAAITCVCSAPMIVVSPPATVWAFDKPEATPSKTPELIIQSGHSDKVNLLTFSSDNKMLASAGADGTVKLWNVEQECLMRTINVSQYWIHSIAFSPKNTLLATGSGDNAIRLWDTQTGRPKGMPMKKHTHAITALAFSPDGTTLASGSGVCRNASDIGTIYLWDVNSGKQKGDSLPIENGNVLGLMFLDENHLVSVSENAVETTIAVWDLKNGIPSKINTGKVGRYGFAMNKGNIAILGGYVQSEGGWTKKNLTVVRVWELPSGRWKQDLDVTGLGITGIAIPPDQDSLWMLTSQKIYQKNIETGDVQAEIPGDFSSVIEISPSGQTMAFVSQSNAISLMNAKPGNVPKKLSTISRSVRSISFSHNGELLASGLGDGGVSVWDTKLGQRIVSFQGHTAPVHSIDFSAQDKFMMTAAIDGEVSLWNPTTWEKSKDMLRMFVSGADDPIERERLDSRSEINLCKRISAPRQFRLADDGEPRSLMVSAVSPDGSAIAYAGYRKFVDIWNLQNGNKSNIFRGSGQDQAGINALAFSLKGDLLAFGDEAGQIFVKSFSPEAKIIEMGKHTQRINALAFSPSDTNLLASASSDGSITLWDIARRQSVKKAEEHEAPVLSLAFSITGLHLATGGTDNIIDIWEMPSFKHLTSLEGHASSISALEYTHDKKYLISGSEDGTIMIWDTETYHPLATVASLGEDEWIVFAPDGRFDTDNLDRIQVLSWVMPDDPMRPLSPEIFMRNYYEPRLLPRVLSGDKFKSIRLLGELNRIQPHVEIVKIEPGDSPDVAKVTVEVGSVIGWQGGENVKTDVYDLRLYRNGQLVGQWPKAREITYSSLDLSSEKELNAWREVAKVPLDPDGEKKIPFTVKLLRREDIKEVEFTAYAFNQDRVKSKTTRKIYKIPPKLEPTQPVLGRAYIITVGVSDNQDIAWSLIAPARDAELIQNTLAKHLEDSKKFRKVVSVPLITKPLAVYSDDEETEKKRRSFIEPTKENIKTVIDKLANREVSDTSLKQIPQELRSELQPVQPEDLVILSFSSHGVTENGEFYILPYDLGTGSGGKVTTDLRKRSISSQELSLWLSAVDAEQIFMIIDACHSGAAVDVEGFKPGPMGNPGLGQLSYDKGMPILAATHAAGSAWAEGGYSLLTWALAGEAIGEKKLALMDAMKYAEQCVPKMRQGNQESVQEPKLFYFKRTITTNDVKISPSVTPIPQSIPKNGLTLNNN
jgi:WD40 repeat protein